MTKAKLILFLLFYPLSTLFSFGQGNVSLDGKQFKLNGSNYYPLILNYGVASVYNGSNYYMAPSHMYGLNNDYECINFNDCVANMQNDFNIIAGMGFNSIRIAGLYPLYVPGQGLVFPFSGHNLQGDLNMLVTQQNLNSNILPLYGKILEIANNTINNLTLDPSPLKVIFILTGRISDYSIPEQIAFQNFANDLSVYIENHSHSNALLAYDLMNEPCYHDTPIKTKQEACEMINQWYVTIKNNDPSHLITLGSCGIGDLLEFDPSIIKTDFLSLHTYPFWAPYENNMNPVDFQRAIDRTTVDMFWLNRNASVPWIIGEISLSADDINAPLQGIIAEGTELQQIDYANYSLDAACNCGGSGYSWWHFQDACHMSLNTPSSWYGLLRMCPLNGHQNGEKPVINNVFRVYQAPSDITTCDNCPVNYSSTYNPNLVYYNPFQHPVNSLNTVKGTITDQDGNPVKDAFIGGHTFVSDNGTPPPNTNDDIYDYHYTFTDENGYFEIIPYDFILPFDGEIANIHISAAGSERLNYGWCCNTIPTSHIINSTLNQLNFKYDAIINNISVPTTFTRNFKGYNTLTASNITIQSNANSNFTARNEVHLVSEFNANKFSEVHIFCSQTNSDCSDFSSFIMQYRIAKEDLTISKSEKEIEIDFHGTSEKPWLKIYPNPNGGSFNVSLISNDNQKMTTIKIMDVMGKEIERVLINASNYTFQLNDQPKGLYFLQLYSSNQSFFHKIIIQ
ncbi:MAG: T9SS type A sorting domain-containing protein [Bacteroidia bacterium]|nr:T9SS type A sorting domain-containing protein [Bacteroidia bacterium]